MGFHKGELRYMVEEAKRQRAEAQIGKRIILQAEKVHKRIIQSTINDLGKYQKPSDIIQRADSESVINEIIILFRRIRASLRYLKKPIEDSKSIVQHFEKIVFAAEERARKVRRPNNEIRKIFSDVRKIERDGQIIAHLEKDYAKISQRLEDYIKFLGRLKSIKGKIPITIKISLLKHNQLPEDKALSILHKDHVIARRIVALLNHAASVELYKGLLEKSLAPA